MCHNIRKLGGREIFLCHSLSHFLFPHELIFQIERPERELKQQQERTIVENERLKKQILELQQINQALFFEKDKYKAENVINFR